MALIQYDPLVAYDATSGELLVTATGTIHTLDDVDALTPLPVTDLAGVPLAGAQVPVVRGLTTGFRVEDAQRVMWVSGDHRITLWSPTGLQAAAESAASSAASSLVSVTGQVDRAEQAAVRAETAAGQVAVATDEAVSEILAIPTSATVAALYALGLGLSASATAPTDPAEGDVWWDSTTGRLMRYDATYLVDWVPVGEPPPTTSYQGLALGRAVVTGSQAVAVGTDASAASTQGVAVGFQASASDGYAAVALGAAAVATGDYSLAIRGAASGTSSVAVGDQASASETNALAVGVSSSASGQDSQAIGTGASAAGPHSTALGADARVSPWGSSALAAGRNAAAAASESVALGAYSLAQNSRAIAIGAGATTGGDDEAVIAAAVFEVAPHFDAATDASTLVLRSPDGTRWRIAVDDAGVLSTTEIL